LQAGGNAGQAAELVRDAALGDDGAWSALVDRYAPLVWSVIRGYRLGFQDAADVSQTTWMRLAENIDRLREPERVGAWLATTAGRECLRLLKRNRRQLPTDDEVLADVPDADPASLPETGVMRSAERDELLWVLSTLPQRSQVLIRMLFADPPPSYKQISEATGMSIGSIGPTRGRLLQELRHRLTLHTSSGTPARTTEA
jgi:RNA polymerase sigma factor (sigma-70 family)